MKKFNFTEIVYKRPEVREHSEETKKKISEAQMGAKNSHSRKVINTDTGYIYDTVTECARAYGLSQGALSNMLSGRRKNLFALEYYKEKVSDIQ